MAKGVKSKQKECRCTDEYVILCNRGGNSNVEEAN